MWPPRFWACVNKPLFFEISVFFRTTTFDKLTLKSELHLDGEFVRVLIASDHKLKRSEPSKPQGSGCHGSRKLWLTSSVWGRGISLLFVCTSHHRLDNNNNNCPHIFLFSLSNFRLKGFQRKNPWVHLLVIYGKGQKAAHIQETTCLSLSFVSTDRCDGSYSHC